MNLFKSVVDFLIGEAPPDHEDEHDDNNELPEAPANAPRLYLSQSEPTMVHMDAPTHLPTLARNISSPARVSNDEPIKKTSWMSIYPHSRHPNPLVFCRLCFENNYAMDSWKLQSCNHSFCMACIRLRLILTLFLTCNVVYLLQFINRAYLTAQLNSGVFHIGCPFQHECNTCISREEMTLILPQAAEVGDDTTLQGLDPDNTRGDYFIMSTNTKSDRDLNEKDRDNSQSDNVVELQVHETVLLDSQLCPQCRVPTYRLNSCNHITCRACATVRSTSTIYSLFSRTNGYIWQ
jgi:hypothetical protein